MEPWWNPGGTLVEPWWNPGGTLVEPSWNLTSVLPRTTPEPIWAETPKLAAVGEKKHSKPSLRAHPLSDAFEWREKPRKIGRLSLSSAPRGVHLVAAGRAHLPHAPLPANGELDRSPTRWPHPIFHHGLKSPPGPFARIRGHE